MAGNSNPSLLHCRADSSPELVDGLLESALSSLGVEGGIGDGVGGGISENAVFGESTLANSSLGDSNIGRQGGLRSVDFGPPTLNPDFEI